jgi:hypothetical protein
MGGRRVRSVVSLTVHDGVMVCDGCHTTHHGVGARLRIEIEDAEREDGVRFTARTASDRGPEVARNGP